MNCRDWEERLALYAGGDLAKADAAEVERHLGECPGCQMFSSGLKESQELIEEVRREPLALAHFAAVRARVLAELELGRRPFWQRRWVFGLAAAAVALLVVVAVTREFSPIPRPSIVALGHPSAPVTPVPPTVQSANPPAHPAHQRRVDPKAQPGERVLIRMVPDNPDVVIYWIADTRGD